MSTSETLFLDF